MKVIIFYILIWYIDFGNAEIKKSKIEKENEAILKLLKESNTSFSQFQDLFKIQANHKMADSNTSIMFEKLSTDASTLGTKLQEAYKNIISQKPKLTNVDEEKLWEKEVATVKDQISSAAGVLNGLMTVFKGVHKNDLLSVVTGTLNTISSILMFTGPAGVLAGSIISLVSFTLSAIFAKERKSESQVILDGVKSILEEYKDDILNEKTNNYFHSLDNEKQQLDGLLKIKEHNEKGINKIKELIEKSIVFSKDQEIWISINTAMKDCDSFGKCSNCLAKLQHYLIVSLQSEMFARQLAGLRHEVPIAHHDSYFNSTLNHLESKIEWLLMKRQKFMSYLLVVSTVENELKWNCIAEYYKYPGTFENIDVFLKYYANQTLRESEESFIIIWENVDFSGRHDKYTTKGKNRIDYKASTDYKAKTHLNWKSNFKLIFVPRKYEVVLNYDDDKNQEQVIKIYGPTLIEVPDVTFNTLVFNINEQFSGEYFRICKEAEMVGPCFQIDTKDLNKNYTVAKNMFPAKSLYIPSGWNVDIYGKDTVSFLNFHLFDKETATFKNKGPLLLDNICKVFEIKNLGNFFYENPAENRSKICSQEYFGGWCSYIDASDTIFDNNLHGCKWNDIKSYAIPMNWKLAVTTSGKRKADDFTGTNRTSDISNIQFIYFELDGPSNLKKKIKRRKEKSRRKERKN